jgi:hypothetical protein
VAEYSYSGFLVKWDNLHRLLVRLYRFSSQYKMKDEGYSRKNQQQVNQATGDVKNGESSNPCNQQNHE